MSIKLFLINSLSILVKIKINIIEEIKIIYPKSENCYYYALKTKKKDKIDNKYNSLIVLNKIL